MSDLEEGRVDFVWLFHGVLRDSLRKPPWHRRASSSSLLSASGLPSAQPSWPCPATLPGQTTSIQAPRMGSTFGLWEACHSWTDMIPQCTQLCSQTRAVPALPSAFRLLGTSQIPIPKLQRTLGKGLQMVLLKPFLHDLR